MGGGEEEPDERKVDPDECIVFRQLRERKGGAAGPGDSFDDDDDFAAARGSTGFNASADGQLFAERLAKVQQMTGLADQVYVEAFLQVHSFDLVLELLVVNRTQETLQNVLVELSTQGDLKLVDKPSAVTLAPGQQMMTHASIKVSSTETGVVFGYVTYDKKSAADKECTVLNELHVDILDYIERAWISELAFRTMWSEFEWENKININTSISEVGNFLMHIMKNTNMSIVGRSYKKPAAGDKKKDNRRNSRPRTSRRCSKRLWASSSSSRPPVSSPSTCTPNPSSARTRSRISPSRGCQRANCRAASAFVRGPRVSP